MCIKIKISDLITTRNKAFMLVYIAEYSKETF